MIKTIIPFLFFVFTVHITSAQVIPKEYNDLVKMAEKLQQAKDYKHAGPTYTSAFKAFGWKAFPDDRYKAASAWSMANIADSAFYQLKLIEGYSKIVEGLASDPSFNPLHNDRRWQPLLNRIQVKNKYSE